jgi:hypothetical protein
VQLRKLLKRKLVFREFGIHSFFARLRAAVIALSKTSLTPYLLIAEHSAYPFAPISFGLSSPCYFAIGDFSSDESLWIFEFHHEDQL